MCFCVDACVCVFVWTSSAAPVLSPVSVTPSATPLMNSEVTFNVMLQRSTFPAPSYAWAFNGTFLDSNPSKYVFSSSNMTLRVLNLQSSDTGMYSVTAMNTVGSNTSSASILVHGKPVGLYVSKTCTPSSLFQLASTYNTLAFSGRPLITPLSVSLLS